MLIYTINVYYGLWLNSKHPSIHHLFINCSLYCLSLDGKRALVLFKCKFRSVLLAVSVCISWTMEAALLIQLKNFSKLWIISSISFAVLVLFHIQRSKRKEVKHGYDTVMCMCIHRQLYNPQILLKQQHST